MEKIRKNDEVIVLTGKDKGKRGLVQQRVDALHVVVEGVNVAKKAVKPNPMTGGVHSGAAGAAGGKSAGDFRAGDCRTARGHGVLSDDRRFGLHAAGDGG